MKKAFGIIFGILVGLSVIFLFYYLISNTKEVRTVYETESPYKSTILRKTVATGSVLPRQEIEIKPQVSGIIEKMMVKAGDNVTKGQLLAKVKIIPNMINLSAAQSRLKRAAIALHDAEQDYHRQEKLFKENVIAEADFSKFQVAHENAIEELHAANDNLALIKEGAVKGSDAASNTLIRSTVDGMVLSVPIKEGNSVIESNNFNDGTTIASIADMRSMIFEGKVDESEVGKIKLGMPLVLSIGALENQTFDAELQYISPKGILDAGAIKFEIKAEVQLRDSVFIRANYSANADIVLEKKDSIFVIDESLIEFRNDSAFVQLETEPQVFEETYIETGLSDGIKIELLSGIETDAKLKSKVKSFE